MTFPTAATTPGERPPSRSRRGPRRALATASVALLVLAACGGDGDEGSSPDTVTTAPNSDPTTSEPTTGGDPVRLTLVTYDSFPSGGTDLEDALAEFTATTGFEVNVLDAGDTGTMISKAVLTAGNPEGDVMWGVDNTFLSRAVEGDVFEPYRSGDADALRADLLAVVPDDLVTPVDFGDVCVNVDLDWFADEGLDVPTSLEDLADPAYADLLVVQNPATSSPGLAFVLGTIAHFGDDGWQDYWRSLRDNGVAVTDGWTDAYYGSSTWAGGGDRPLVVSYGSSPPAEVIFADPPREDAPTGVVEATCFRQVEFAGVLRGTQHPDAARALVDFLISERFQALLPLELFVYPARDGVDLPSEFESFAVVPDAPLTMSPERIDAGRADWIDEWTGLVLG